MQDQLDRIEKKQDQILSLVLKHETQINDDKIGLLTACGNQSERIGSLETSRTRFIAWASGIGISSGGIGAWLAKILNLGGAHQ